MPWVWKCSFNVIHVIQYAIRNSFTGKEVEYWHIYPYIVWVTPTSDDRLIIESPICSCFFNFISIPTCINWNKKTFRQGCVNDFARTQTFCIHRYNRWYLIILIGNWYSLKKASDQIDRERGGASSPLVNLPLSWRRSSPFVVLCRQEFVVLCKPQ